VIASARKAKLNIRYHNPNTDEETLKYASKIFIEASRIKFENILREIAMKDNTHIVMEKSPQ